MRSEPIAGASNDNVSRVQESPLWGEPLTTRTVRRAIQRGELAAEKRGGHFLITAEALEGSRFPRTCAFRDEIPRSSE